MIALAQSFPAPRWSCTTLLKTPTPFGNQTWYADPFLKRPLSNQWNFGIQEALGKSTVLTVN
jgi:hypothetical protein